MSSPLAERRLSRQKKFFFRQPGVAVGGGHTPQTGGVPFVIVSEKGRLRKKIRGVERAKFHGRFLQSAKFWLQKCAILRNALRMLDDRNA
jgi:hypothetical protein